MLSLHIVIVSMTARTGTTFAHAVVTQEAQREAAAAARRAAGKLATAQADARAAHGGKQKLAAEKAALAHRLEVAQGQLQRVGSHLLGQQLLC